MSSVFREYGLFGDWRIDFGTPVWFARLFIRLGQAYVLAFLFVETLRAFIEWLSAHKKNRIQTLGILAAIPAVAFSIVYTPEWANYRIMYPPGLVLLLALALERRFELDRPRFRKIWPLVLAVFCLFSVNLVVKAIPESDSTNNPFLTEAIQLRNVLDENSLYIVSGTDDGFLRGLYARYSTRCEYVKIPHLLDMIREDEAKVVESFGERLLDGHIILIHEDVFSAEDVAFLETHHGLDLNLSEFAAFIDRYVEFKNSFIINKKKFFIIGLKAQTNNGS